MYLPVQSEIAVSHSCPNLSKPVSAWRALLIQKKWRNLKGSVESTFWSNHFIFIRNVPGKNGVKYQIFASIYRQCKIAVKIWLLYIKNLYFRPKLDKLTLWLMNKWIVYWTPVDKIIIFSSENTVNLIIIIWAPSSEFVSSSIPSWKILTAHAQPFRGARDLAFCLKVPLDSLLVWASSEGSGETARMHRLAWTFAARIGDKYQIRLTRSICYEIGQIYVLVIKRGGGKIMLQYNFLWD